MKNNKQKKYSQPRNLAKKKKRKHSRTKRINSMVVADGLPNRSRQIFGFLF